jgi:hypothetical protein
MELHKYKEICHEIKENIIEAFYFYKKNKKIYMQPQYS